MEIVKTFGNYIEKWCETVTGKSEVAFKDRMGSAEPEISFSSRRAVDPSDQYLAGMMMNVMTQPLKHPESSVMVSVFTPCELLQEAGLYPYNVEKLFLLSCGITGRETFSSGSRGFWNFRNTLQLSQDIYRSCRKGPSSETEMYRLYEPGV